MTDPALAQQLIAEGVVEVGPDDDPDELLPLYEGLGVEHATARAVLLTGTDSQGNDVEHWLPKSVLRADEPEALVTEWFVEANNAWELVA